MTRRTIILLHGFMGDPSDWDDVRSALTEYEIITPYIPPALDWNDGIRLLSHEVPQRSILVGYSMGARLLLSLATTKPELVDGLVFVSGNPGIEANARQVRYQIDSQLAQRIEQEPRREFLTWWYRQGPFQSLTTEQVDIEIKRKMNYHGEDWGKILRTYSISHQPNLWDALKAANFPILAIAGEEDRKYTKIVTKMGGLAHVDARILPGCGHIVHHEQPEIFSKLMREFLAKIDPSALVLPTDNIYGGPSHGR